MEIIIAIVISLLTLAGIAYLVKVNRSKKKNEPLEEDVSIPAPGCCGTHEVCDFDQIKSDENRIEYYDDEELDEYKNRDARQYTYDQIEQFREVLYTLQTREIKYWLLSIERRKIALPTILVSEARNLMAEG